MKPNANLIAAAPELLDALEEIVGLIGFNPHVEDGVSYSYCIDFADDEVEQRLARAKAAIAKAKGGK